MDRRNAVDANAPPVAAPTNSERSATMHPRRRRHSARSTSRLGYHGKWGIPKLTRWSSSQLAYAAISRWISALADAPDIQSEAAVHDAQSQVLHLRLPALRSPMPADFDATLLLLFVVFFHEVA